MVYLDNSATTAVSSSAAQKALSIMQEQFGNPSSLHKLGFEAEKMIKNARRMIASALSCREGEIYFTSGGTEANNTAIIGTANAKKRQGNKIVISAIEHSSVIAAAEHLSKNGFEVVKVYPDKNGVITPDKIAAAVDDKTILVSLMHVNNEVGSVMDVATAAAGARRKNSRVTVHCDAVQAFGKIPVHTGRLGVDLLTVSAHKIHGPKGCGALFVKKGTRIDPIIFGGQQQNGFRPGTENTAGIAAFGEACEETLSDMAKNFQYIKSLRNRLVEGLAKIDGIQINSSESALPFIVNFSTMCVKSETMMHFLEGREIYVSGGSACAKGNRSHVLVALGLPDRAVDTAIRVSFCAQNTAQDLDDLLSALKEGMETLQKLK
ncbi:MAG: cysteine desulfurase family protein [Oscillospiraceae bacterium]|nr:cysteine desulfurase family protein [Oscillospiraceae bacterium]